MLETVRDAEISELFATHPVIEHGRRWVLHFNTRHPTADWVVQQLREAFPEAVLYRYAILDQASSRQSGFMNMAWRRFRWRAG
jgi:hypothetical protein